MTIFIDHKNKYFEFFSLSRIASNQKMANLKRFFNYSVSFIRCFRMTILLSYVHPKKIM